MASHMDAYVERDFENHQGLYDTSPISLEAQVRSTLALEKIAENLDRIAAVQEEG